MTYKRKITGVQQSGSKQKQHKSDEEYSDSAERASSRGTSHGKRRGARGARGAGELRRSQRISKAPAQGRGEEGEDEGENEEEEVLLTSTQQKPYKPNKHHLFNKPNNAKWPNKPNKPHP